MTLLWLALLLSCKGADPEDSTIPAGTPGGSTSGATSSGSTTTVPLDERIARFRQLADEAGFDVMDGTFSHLDADDSCCIGEESHCLGNNPTTPYGLHAIPPLPGQTGDSTYRQDDGTYRAFRLREDSVLVQLGPLPPEARYLSVRSMVGFSPEPGEDDRIVTGSLGASLNHLVIAEQLGTEQIWGRDVAILTTSDAAIERTVHGLLEASGFASNEVLDDRIVHELANFGLTADSDLFMVGTRLAVIEDPAEEAAYYADPQSTLLSLVPREPIPITEPHPVPELQPRGWGTDEDHLASALDDLDAAIRAQYADKDILYQPMNEFWAPLFSCLSTQCGGAIHDRYVGTLPPFLIDDTSRIGVVFGVNHERTGKGAYSNFTVDDVSRHMGLASVDSRDMVGSARYFLPDHPFADDLYAWVIGRDCSVRPEPNCIEIPTGCPGIDTGLPWHLTFRVYLEESTGAAPLHDEMLPDRVFLVDDIEPG